MNNQDMRKVRRPSNPNGAEAHSQSRRRTAGQPGRGPRPSSAERLSSQQPRSHSEYRGSHFSEAPNARDTHSGKHRPRTGEGTAAPRRRPAADRNDFRGRASAPQPKRRTAAAKPPVKQHENHIHKRRKMTTKEKIAISLVSVAAAFLIVIMFLNMKLFPAVQYDDFGREYPIHISLMQKFRNWKPFIATDGELESKDYSMEPKSEIDGVVDGMINDGLDLDQIQEGQFAVLFLGTDESRSNTDVMMLAMFDIRGNQIHILQIPRDTFVPGYTAFEAYKINSVYTMGDQTKAPVQRVVDCIENIYKIPIDRYITTSCTDIVEIVDLIGGIPIDMPYKITYEADKIIEAGKQTLNGQQAEWMVRFRHDYSEGDIGRMKAQRIFMAAAMERVCDIGTIELMTYVDKIVDKKLIGSNLTVDEISKLSDFATSIGMDRISMHMLPGEGYNYEPPMPSSDIKVYSVWSMHKRAVINLLNTYFRPYFEEEPELAIPELVTEGNYLSTLYDDDVIDFQQIDDGEGFQGT
ncbi:MAG: LCP family protein [Oscillospiraceae bacterium]|nr:LCP family protein [Oscillospiraceae bacterium]